MNKIKKILEKNRKIIFFSFLLSILVSVIFYNFYPDKYTHKFKLEINLYEKSNTKNNIIYDIVNKKKKIISEECSDYNLVCSYTDFSKNNIFKFDELSNYFIRNEIYKILKTQNPERIKIKSLDILGLDIEIISNQNIKNFENNFNQINLLLNQQVGKFLEGEKSSIYNQEINSIKKYKILFIFMILGIWFFLILGKIIFDLEFKTK